MGELSSIEDLSSQIDGDLGSPVETVLTTPEVRSFIIENPGQSNNYNIILVKEVPQISNKSDKIHKPINHASQSYSRKLQINGLLLKRQAKIPSSSNLSQSSSHSATISSGPDSQPLNN